ncbi:glucokinase [Zhengella mangrovi]|uniref:Glucokinase n=1 Tax=Zhengella mangrovi TaxID=1982044 RepID=A0A2G1QLK4_9HYPH|nr:ROK family protein [Zhengella mangrovi]PHP66382.1 glucokinase [Zhengella mangrovi]
MSFPVIAGDVGGTNSRFRLIGPDGAALGETLTLKNAAYPSIIEALTAAYPADVIRAAQTLVIAVACPVDEPPFHLTNAPWVIDPAAVKAALGLSQVHVMNDFMAQGLACASLPLDTMQQIGGHPREEAAPRVVVGPGTGLGVAQLIRACGKWIVIPGEGGHLDLGPRTEREFALWPHLEMRGCRLEVEMAVSGQGLENLYRGLRRLDRHPDREEAVSAAQVTERAHSGEALAVEAVTLFTTILARFCGDLALLTLAHGGVYLAGGMTAHLIDLVRGPAFRQAFEDKPPFSGIMAEIPLYLMPGGTPALDGIAAYAADPQAFEVERAIHVTR